jgi:hypothetical protein
LLVIRREEFAPFFNQLSEDPKVNDKTIFKWHGLVFHFILKPGKTPFVVISNWPDNPDTSDISFAPQPTAVPMEWFLL